VTAAAKNLDHPVIVALVDFLTVHHVEETTVCVLIVVLRNLRKVHWDNGFVFAAWELHPLPEVMGFLLAIRSCGPFMGNHDDKNNCGLDATVCDFFANDNPGLRGSTCECRKLEPGDDSRTL